LGAGNSHTSSPQSKRGVKHKTEGGEKGKKEMWLEKCFSRQGKAPSDERAPSPEGKTKNHEERGVQGSGGKVPPAEGVTRRTTVDQKEKARPDRGEAHLLWVKKKNYRGKEKKQKRRGREKSVAEDRNQGTPWKRGGA